MKSDTSLTAFWGLQVIYPQDFLPESRLAKHLALVRDLSIRLNGDFMGQLDFALDDVSLLPEGLLPNLRTLNIETDHDPESHGRLIKVLDGLLTPSVRRFSLRFSRRGRREDYDASTCVPLLEVIKNRTSGLVTLCFKQHRDVPSQGHISFAQVLKANPSIHSLTFTQTSADLQAIINEAANLPNLTCLSFCDGSSSDYAYRDADPTIGPLPHGFPALHAFKAHVGTQSFPHILDSLPISFMKNLYLRSTDHDAPPSSLHALSQFTNLTTLSLHLQSEAHVWEHVLRHVLPCMRLESLAVTVPYAARDLTNEMVECMASAWPSLQSLVVLPDGGRAGRPTVSLGGLACLAVLCPELQTLRMEANVSHLPEEVDSLAAVGLAVTTLDLATSPRSIGPADPRLIDFICRMWPNQRSEDREMETEFSNPEHWIWSAVDARLKEESRARG